MDIHVIDVYKSMGYIISLYNYLIYVQVVLWIIVGNVMQTIVDVKNVKMDIN